MVILHYEETKKSRPIGEDTRVQKRLCVEGANREHLGDCTFFRCAPPCEVVEEGEKRTRKPRRAQRPLQCRSIVGARNRRNDFEKWPTYLQGVLSRSLTSREKCNSRATTLNQGR